MTDGYTLEALGDRALIVRFGTAIDADTVARVHAVARHARASAPALVEDVVPAYASVAVHLAHEALDARALAQVETWLRQCAQTPASGIGAGRVIEIPVQYGGSEGPDLAAVAAHAGLSVDEVVERHAAGEYIVAMIGFAPGFPYLLGLDPRLATPRHAQPRTRVPAGSVGIGGAQTGVYPRAGPGGWQLIGRTTSVLFDAGRAPPSLLQPGDRVRFLPR